MEPQKAHSIIQAINQTLENLVVQDGQPVLLTAPMLRPHLAQLLIRFIPTLPVISQAEIPPDIRLESVAIVSLNNAN